MPGAERWWWAALVLALYALGCGLLVLQRRRLQAAARREAAAWSAPVAADASGPPVLVVHASQTGYAEELARQTAKRLHTAGTPVRLLALAELDAALLRASERALFIVSTCGEGDPPDTAAPFARRVMAADPDLAGLHVGLLALGDRSYAQFCGFGRALDAWLQARGAQPLFERIELDNADPQALDTWRHRLSHLAGTGDLPDWDAPTFGDWRLVERRRLNPGGEGGPAFHLVLVPAAGPLPEWQAGDLAQVCVPTEPDRPREYSIASLPADGGVQLLVRQQRREDGGLGIASGWLTDGAAIGDTVALRLRAHAGFRAERHATRPLVLIGNGTGLAGLRAHLRARAAARAASTAVLPPPCWLLFGERQSAHDAWYDDEIRGWLDDGTLARADRVYSRDQAERRYVQHVLAERGDGLRHWVAGGAALLVCGSLDGMAGAVDAVLGELLGTEAVQALAEEGRYLRDVY